MGQTMAATMQGMTKEEATQRIEGCGDTDVPQLFTNFPEEIKKDTTIVNSCIQKCLDSSYDDEHEKLVEPLIELFAAFPDEIKKDTTILNRCIQKCHGEDISKLFKAYPEEIKRDTTIVNSCIERSSIRHGRYIPELFEAFPEEIKKDTNICNSCIQKCRDDLILNVFKKFPEEIKKDSTIVNSCIQKCHDTFIPKLFDEFPNEIQTDSNICSACIERCNFAEIGELKQILPDPPKSDRGIKTKLEAKEGEGGICQKYKILLTTIPRLFCGMGILGGMVEGLVKLTEIFGEEKAFAVHWRKIADKKYIFEPLRFCRMPPPQPLWIATIYNSMKAMILTLMFGYLSRHLKEDQRKHIKSSLTKRVAFVMAAVLQLTLVPITQALMIWSFFTDPSGPNGWKAFECFYLHWGSSFFDFGYWLLLVRGFGVDAVLTASDLAREYKEEAEKALLKPSVQIADLRDTLLGHDTLLHGGKDGHSSNDTVALEYKKLIMIKNATVICAYAYVIIDLPFLVIYKLPAGIAFLPVLFILARFIIASFRITWPSGWKAFVKFLKEEENKYSHPDLDTLVKGCLWKMMRWFLIGENPERSYELCTGSNVANGKHAWEEAERTGFLVFFPILFGMAIINLILTYGSVYLYNGLGYFKSIVIVIAERKMSYYWDNFYSQVLGNYWAACSLVSEVS